MGNQVTFAVHHDYLDSIRSLQFDEAVSHAIHNAPAYPRWFDKKTKGQMFENNGIVVSHYFHASFGVTHYIDSQGMIYNPIFSLMGEEDLEGGVNSIIAEAKRTSKYMFHPDSFSVRKDPKQSTSVAKPDKPCKISIFGVLTDQIHEIENRPDVMATLVDAIENDNCQLLERSAIKHIGTINGTEAALVRMKGNCFNAKMLDVIPTGSLRADLANLESEKLKAKEVELVVAKSLLNGLGYQFAPTKRRTQDHEQNEGLTP